MKKYLSLAAALLCSAILFTSCLGDDDNNNTNPDVYTITMGAFVLNEGNYYNNISGSLSYIDLQNATVTNNYFKQINQRSLGGTPNCIVTAGTEGDLYIACTDENRIEITDSKVKSVAYVNVEKPREMCADDSYVYVTSYNGTVSKISIKDRKVSSTSAVVGANLEGITLRNGYLYVCNSYNPDYTYNSNVVKLSASTLEKVGDIAVAVNPTSIKVSGDNIYVLSSGNYNDVSPRLQKIDSADKVSLLTTAVYFDVLDGMVFGIDSSYNELTKKTQYSYFGIAKSGAIEEIIPPFDIPAPCAINIDPNSATIFVSSYKMGDSGYPDYSAPGYIYAFRTYDNYAKKFDLGVGPRHVLFNHMTYVSK